MRFVELPRLALACPLLVASLLTAGELKVDINRDGKNTAAQTAAGYIPWAAANEIGTTSTGTAAITHSFPLAATGETVTVAFSLTSAARGAGGTGLTYTYHGAGSLNEESKLASDGITVAPSFATEGGQIQMTVTGLTAGKHSLLTFHNAGDSAVQLGSLAPVKAYLNGVLAATFTPSIRAKDRDTPTAYFTFSTASASDVTTILFEADDASAATTRNVVINGFEIDTPNALRMAGTPSPADGNAQVEASAGKVTLSWASAVKGAAVSHEVYFGTSLADLETANRSSPAYIGNQTENSWTVPAADKKATYYWRIDERDALGNVTTGAVWSFRLSQAAGPGADDYSQTVFVSLGGKDRHASVITIPVPGHGWNYSAVAPIPGEHWNRIRRTEGVDATDPAVAATTQAIGGKLGSYVLNTANEVPLVDPTGKQTGLTLTIQIELNALAGDKSRFEPTTQSKGKQSIPAGLMDVAWRVYLPQNSLVFTVSGLTPGRAYDLYAYGAASDPATNADGAKDGARFTLAPPNCLPGVPATAETTGGFCASVHTYTVETDRIAPSPGGSTWVRLSAQADPKGKIRFSTSRNSNSRQFVNGFQLVPSSSKP